MTAQIINLAERRKVRKQAKIDPIPWPFRASLGLFEAYLAMIDAIAMVEAMPAGGKPKTIIIRTED